MSEHYLWLKAAHIVVVTAWMAGLFYLPRLFVYHADAKPSGEISETFKAMERRLLKAIMTPALIAVWLTGVPLAWLLGLAGWLWLKLALVVGLTAFHLWLGRIVRDFAGDARPRSGRFYRIINEVPTLALIAIVVLVVLKPDF